MTFKVVAYQSSALFVLLAKVPMGPSNISLDFPFVSAYLSLFMILYDNG